MENREGAYDLTSKLESWIYPRNVSSCPNIPHTAARLHWMLGSSMIFNGFGLWGSCCCWSLPGSPKSTGGVRPWWAMPQWIWEALGAGSTAQSRHARAAEAWSSEQWSWGMRNVLPQMSQLSKQKCQCCFFLHGPWDGGFNVNMWRFPSVWGCPFFREMFFRWTSIHPSWPIVRWPDPLL